MRKKKEILFSFFIHCLIITLFVSLLAVVLLQHLLLARKHEADAGSLDELIIVVARKVDDQIDVLCSSWHLCEKCGHPVVWSEQRKVILCTFEANAWRVRGTLENKS